MTEYLLLMRGSQTAFMQMNETEQRAIINDHIAWSRELDAKGVLIGGNGCSDQTVLLNPSPAGITPIPRPFAGTEHELSGFYVIQAENLEAAIAIANHCPALRHGESVEVVPLGH